MDKDPVHPKKRQSSEEEVPVQEQGVLDRLLTLLVLPGVGELSASLERDIEGDKGGK